MPKRKYHTSPCDENIKRSSRRDLEQEISNLKTKLRRRHYGSRSSSPTSKRSRNRSRSPKTQHRRHHSPYSPSRSRKRSFDHEKRQSSSRSFVHSELIAQNNNKPISDRNKRSYPSSIQSGLLTQDNESYQSRTEEDYDTSDIDAETQVPSPPRSLTSPVPAPQTETITENCLEEDILQILGVAGIRSDTFELNAVVTNVWKAILSEGVEKNERSKLLEKFTVPVNLPTLNAPKVNEEITSAVADNIIKKDMFLVNRQKQLGKGLAGIGAALTLLLKNKSQEGFYKELMQHLSDTGRILTDLHFRMSLSRRVLITPHLNKNVKTLTATSPVGEYLFDTDLGEKIKAAKAVEKTGKEIKKPVYTSFISNTKLLPAKPYSSSLNYRGPLRKGRALQQAGQYPRSSRTESRPSNKRRQ